ncbi:MAG TPA: zinc dependent phospholipase C family protein [Candidatus Acidoferrales bacterium]
MKTCNWRIALAAMTVAMMLAPQTTPAYSVFTHEELIDLTWRSAIRPLLLERFPGSTDAQLREAHAFAYGGCAAQDMGYYPFGNKFFSDLTHYVRAGDFINNLFLESRNVDEYAFAIGALSHYIGDSIGHSVAVNPSTAINFPGLARRYGPIVTYDENPHAHVRTEYAFDIGQLSKRTFAPPAFMRFIGFRVPRGLLERAFVATYGIEVRELIGKTRPAMKSYRTSVRTLIPIFSDAEIVLHGKQFAPDTDNPEYQQFVKQLRQADYERHWAYTYRGPGIGSHLLAIVIKIIPKIGPASYLAIKIPDAQTEGWYIQSVNRSADNYRRLLENLRAHPTTVLDLPNRDLDTGARVKAGDYALTDDTYAKLVDRLISDPSRTIPDGLRENILEYYGDLSAPISTKKHPREWKRLTSELQAMAGMKSAAASATPSK